MASFHSWKRTQLADNRKVFEQGSQEWLEPVGEKLEPMGEKLEPIGEKLEDIHVFICTDESDLRPLAVLINSSMSNCP